MKAEDTLLAADLFPVAFEEHRWYTEAFEEELRRLRELRAGGLEG